MYWVLFFSAWGGFVLGVLFMAVLAISRENKKSRLSQRALRPPLSAAHEYKAKLRG